jgi:hypothetical protein
VGARRSPLSPPPRHKQRRLRKPRTVFSVVEGAGRNLVDDTRKADKRDDRKDANPIRDAHGLHFRIQRLLLASWARALAQPAFRPVNVPRARAPARNPIRWRARWRVFSRSRFSEKDQRLCRQRLNGSLTKAAHRCHAAGNAAEPLPDVRRLQRAWWLRAGRVEGHARTLWRW